MDRQTDKQSLYKEEESLKGSTVSVILSDPPCIDGNERFTLEALI